MQPLPGTNLLMQLNVRFMSIKWDMTRVGNVRFDAPTGYGAPKGPAPATT